MCLADNEILFADALQQMARLGAFKNIFIPRNLWGSNCSVAEWPSTNSGSFGSSCGQERGLFF
jgi:hypothetical protein